MGWESAAYSRPLPAAIAMPAMASAAATNMVFNTAFM